MRTSRTIRARVVVLLGFVLGLAALERAPARAETDAGRSASARALFEEGVSHTDRAEWTEAADAFRRALALRDSPVIRYNLASALAEQRKIVEATELLHAVEVDARGDAALRQNAADLLRELTPRIARLAIQPPLGRTDVFVTLDGTALDPAQFDVPLAVDPGRHVVEASVGERALEAQVVELAEGDSRRLHLAAPEPEPLVVSAQAPAVAPTPQQTARTLPLAAADSARHDEPLPDRTRRRRLWLGVSGAALGAAAAVALGFLLAPHKQASNPSGDFDPPSIGVNVPP